MKTEEEIKAQAEKTCIMIDKNERACYAAGFLGGFWACEEEHQGYERKVVLGDMDKQNKIVLLSQKVYDLQKAYDKQKEINKEQVDELEEWKAEVERQRLTALRNLDGWRKMDAKLTRAGEIIDRLRRLLDTSVFKNDAVVEAEKFLFEELLREEVPSSNEKKEIKEND